jgi:hypothetical protein
MVTWATNGLKRCKVFLRAGLTIAVGLTKHRTHLFPINRRCGARSGLRSVAWQRSVSRPLGGTQPTSMPGYIEPCDPVLRKVPPSGDE